MELCRLCLGLVSDINFTSLDVNYKGMVQFVAPELNLEVSDNPVMCLSCRSNIDELFSFKTNCFENEERLIQKVSDNDRNNLSIKEVLDGIKVGNLKTEGSKEKMCRICLEPIDSGSFTVLKPTETDSYLSSMLNISFPDIDLELTKDPVMCEKCFENVQKLYHFRTSCIDVEEKITKYCDRHGTSSKNSVNLHSVLQFDFIKCDPLSLIEKPKKEEGSDELKYEPSDDLVIVSSKLKEEEVDIKLDKEGTSKKDKFLRGNIYTSLSAKHLIENGTRNEYLKEGKQLTRVVPLRTLPTEKRIKLHTRDKDNIYDGRFAHKSNLTENHIGEKPFKCDICDSGFAEKHILVEHTRTHTIEKPFKCDTCEARYTFKSSLVRHKKTHRKNKERLFACDTCGKRFSAKNSLKSHSALHAERTFKCGICGKGFVKRSLKYHMKIHSEEKPFKCDMCDKSFKQKNNLADHMIRHKTGKSFKCDICDKTFIHTTSLLRHMAIHLVPSAVKKSSATYSRVRTNT